MKRKKKYIKPASELIQIVNDSPLASGSHSLSGGPDWLNKKGQQVEDNSGPQNKGDHSVAPGGDLEGFAKVNPWSSWDEE